jgi:hypothetical protein
MSRKHKRQRKPGIKNDPAYNPFPGRAGHSIQSYIRGVVTSFASAIGIRRDDFLHRAIELAHAAEKTFKPELGRFSRISVVALNGRLKAPPAARPTERGTGRCYRIRKTSPMKRRKGRRAYRRSELRRRGQWCAAPVRSAVVGARIRTSSACSGAMSRCLGSGAHHVAEG